MGQVAQTTFPGIYLEAMEGAEGTHSKPHKTWYTEMLRREMGICESVLECCRESDTPKIYNK